MKILLALIIGFILGYLFGGNYTDYSEFFPLKAKITAKSVKELLKSSKINGNIIDSSVSSLYCMDTRTHIIKYYPKDKLLRNVCNNRNLNCIYASEMIEIFNGIYYKNKSKSEKLFDNHIKGFTD